MKRILDYDGEVIWDSGANEILIVEPPDHPHAVGIEDEIMGLLGDVEKDEPFRLHIIVEVEERQ